jgi:glycosyltransferase involved in cell wall biosynthesis
VDGDRFSPGDRTEARALLGLPQDLPIMAYVGRFDPRKGIAAFVQAAAVVARVQPVHLVFAGGFDPAAQDAIEHARIRLMIDDLGLRLQTTFLGNVDHDRLPAVYRAADLTVVPSLYEPFGLVAVEAMASGCPVVASRVGGLQYSIADGETGLLVPPGQPDRLAQACLRLLGDKGLRRRMGRAGARRVDDQFTWLAVAERLEALYAGMIAARA